VKAIVVAAALACTGVAGTAEPATFRECSGRVYVYAYGPPCMTAFALVSSAWSERRRHGVGPWRIARAPSWRWWKAGGGLLGNSGTMLVDASIASAPRTGSDCNSRGYVEGVTAYRISCRDALSLVHRLPVRLEPTWVARGFRWWAHPNHEASTVVGIARAAYIYVVV
jgi:hypothetical protein